MLMGTKLEQTVSIRVGGNSECSFSQKLWWSGLIVHHPPDKTRLTEPSCVRWGGGAEELEGSRVSNGSTVSIPTDPTPVPANPPWKEVKVVQTQASNFRLTHGLPIWLRGNL